VAVSKVAIANRALQKLGAKRIESLTQDHPNARSMNACFDQVRDSLLRKYSWSFAIKRDSIAADGDDPVWGDWSRYTKPNDFLALMRDDESGRVVDWKIEGDYILSGDGSPLEIRYLARIEDPSKYDALFDEAFAAKLAFETCFEITASTSKQDRCERDLEEAISEAQRVNAIEKGAETFPEDEWITARA
jgi:hypothetical protein